MTDVPELNDVQKLKFYQKGTLTVGNRLVDEAERTVQASLARSNSLTSGHRACQGCGEALGARYAIDAAMRATEGDLIAVNATGCLEVFTTPYPETSWQMPWMHSLFGNAAAVATGVAAAMRVTKRDTRASSRRAATAAPPTSASAACRGMFERNDDVLYICYDNEGYMNTGVQRSSATPPTARTATTPTLGPEPGNVFGTGKFVPKIAVAHEIPYRRHRQRRRSPRSRGEGDESDGLSRRALHPDQRALPARLGRGVGRHVKLARLAIETGLFPIFEAEHGRVTEVRKIRRKTPVVEYLKLQRRFAHLFRDGREDPRVARLQALADRRIAEYGLLDAEG